MYRPISRAFSTTSGGATELTAPAIDFSHGDGRCSIIMGPRYRGCPTPGYQMVPKP